MSQNHILLFVLTFILLSHIIYAENLIEFWWDFWKATTAEELQGLSDAAGVGTTLWRESSSRT